MTTHRNAAAPGDGTGGERTIHGTDGTSQDTEFVSESLDFARALARSGIPIVLAKPALDAAGHWDPAGGTDRCGYWLPPGWQRTETDPAVLDRYQAGMAVLAVMGHGLDLIDCDPRHNGGRSLESMRRNGQVPTVFAEAATPSGGSHLFVASMGVRSLDNVLPGIDIKAGDPGGRGRGLAFIAPTRKASKAQEDAGKVSVYTWTMPPDLDRLRVHEGREDAADRLVELINKKRGGNGLGDRTERFTLPDVIPVGERNSTLFKYACSLRAQGVPITKVLQLMKEAHSRCEQASGNPFTLDEALARVDSAWKNYEGPTTLEIVTDVAGSTVDEAPASEQFVSGGEFILDVPGRIPAIWGEGDRVLWAQGESLILTGPQGVGKTTLVGQLVEAAIFGGTVLDLPVRKAGRVLYLAMDRPQQIRRSLARTMGNRSRVDLDDRLVIWPGPPPEDVAAQPKTLLNLARRADADVVVVDSIKDAAVGLADDKVGSGYNRARQSCLVNGVELVELHHMVKRGQNGDKPTTLADVYGSTWLTAGAGSVVLLWGDAGNRVVELRHLKQPAGVIGPFKVMHDHHAGRSTVIREIDLVAFTRAAGDDGVAAKQAAAAMTGTDTPQPADVEKARRRLDQLVRDGELHRIDGDRGARRAALWVADTRHESSHDTITLDLSGAASQHHHAASRGKE